jgi:hypothetical protein
MLPPNHKAYPIQLHETKDEPNKKRSMSTKINVCKYYSLGIQIYVSLDNTLTLSFVIEEHKVISMYVTIFHDKYSPCSKILDVLGLS